MNFDELNQRISVNFVTTTSNRLYNIQNQFTYSFKGHTDILSSMYYDADGNELTATGVSVADDGTADFYPSVSGEYLVWQNQKSVMDDGLSLAEIGEQGEIVIAKWNGNGFDAPDARGSGPSSCLYFSHHYR